ncbi:Protein CBG03515 [Caenorhabditis briggsae]|uniref:Protein CBG03515 n=1 Tax=Caenorhabditis briggsae TaxID=6238 RepID=A8WV84_CAEBR|nr:Protein CBG03515 [Caenorhabditis briggsae]CAP24395.1 Protein CBG03515 [Caenorhabditis briggsae]
MKFIFCILFVLGCASAQFSATAQEAILQIHNDLRSSIAKGDYSVNGTGLEASSNMRKMKWDSCLERSARNLAKSCPDKTYKGAKYGENVFVSHTLYPENTFNRIGVMGAAIWGVELGQELTAASLNNTITKKTQMAWAEINLMGCSVKNCGKVSPEKNTTKIVLVCKYELPDNLSSSGMYKPGKACTSCDEGFKCETDSGLCV